MTSKAGMEFINLKQAKYNRDRRYEADNSVPVSNSGAAAKPVYRNSVSAPASDGLTVKDVIGIIGEELASKLAAKRRAAARERANQAKYVAKYVKASTAFPISAIGYIIVFAAIAMFLVIGNTKINEATLKVDSLKSQISAEISEGEVLDTLLTQRKDAAFIENYAVNELGMVKATDVAKTYISISGADKVVVSGTAAR